LNDIALPEEEVTNWLASLQLLQNIPFNNLVADVRMLPVESMRFFYIDPSWTNSAIDGALSIGNSTSLELMFTQMVSDQLKNDSSDAALTLRDGLGDVFDPLNLYNSTLQVGLLLRSEIVSNWPALTIMPTYEDKSISTDPIRFENIGAGILLCIFPAVPTQIEVREPPQGVEFGVFEGGNQLKLFLRGLGENGLASGAQIKQDGQQCEYVFDDDSFRDKDNGVLDITKIVSDIKTILGAEGVDALSQDKKFSPAEFALQFVKTAQKVTIKTDPNYQKQN
jgi:hypothetical protein